MVATGIATSNIAVPTDGNHAATAGPAVKIIGTKTTITIPHPIPRPTEYTIHPHGKDKTPERHVVEIPGKGMHWQADETARAIRMSPTRGLCLYLRHIKHWWQVLMDRRWEIGKRGVTARRDNFDHGGYGSSQRDWRFEVSRVY
jgi:hypothetical protein